MTLTLRRNSRPWKRKKINFYKWNPKKINSWKMMTVTTQKV